MEKSLKPISLHISLAHAEKFGYAIGHFNISESDQFRAICEAANEMRAPVMIGTSEGEAEHIGYLEAIALRDAFQKEYSTWGIYLNADHHKSFETAKKAINAGYDSVHIDLSAKNYEENIIGTRELVEYARSQNKNSVIVNVEGELGYLRGDSRIQKEKIKVKPEDFTDPEKAQNFVAKTGVDRLAIAVGNIHGISLNEPQIDVDRIKKIRAMVPKSVALVLHAGSGIPDTQIREAIRAGISNIHINTEIRVAFTKTLRETLAENPEETTPYKILTPSVEAMKKIIKEKLKIFGSVNKI